MKKSQQALIVVHHFEGKKKNHIDSSTGSFPTDKIHKYLGPLPRTTTKRQIICYGHICARKSQIA